jgi:hypothetical protein
MVSAGQAVGDAARNGAAAFCNGRTGGDWQGVYHGGAGEFNDLLQYAVAQANSMTFSSIGSTFIAFKP